jgi:hypothetical protein
VDLPALPVFRTPPHEVLPVLGHAKASMTLDVYADLFDEDLDGVADRLGLFDFDRAISTKSKLRPAVCGCSGIVSVGPSFLDFGTRSRLA